MADATPLVETPPEPPAPGAPPAAPARRRKRTGRAPGEPRNVAYLYLLPGVLAYLLFTFLPLLHTAWLSFFDWDGITVGTWNGLDNYREILADDEVRAAFVNSLKLVIFYAILPIAAGLLLAAMMSRFRVHGLTAFRTILFLPQTVAMVVVAQAFVWIYAPEGPINVVLKRIGLDDVARGWLGDFTWALPSLGLVGTWVTYGLCMVLFLAGAQKIPISLYEAARVDGAGAFREFMAVTLPGLRNEVVVALTLTTITALRSFDLIYNTTQGGPGGSTRVPSVLIYQNAFRNGKVGLACAIAVVLTLIIFAVAYLIGKVSDAGAEEGA